MNRLATRWLPPARVVHPFPDVRFRVRSRSQRIISRLRGWCCAGLCLSPWRHSPNIYLGDTMTIASCKIKPEGGPPLGRFTLQQTEQDKWYISGNETEACSVLTTALSRPASPDGRRSNDSGE